VRRNIGFIFQAHNLFESLTASQNVEMAVELLDNWRQKRQRAVQMLSWVWQTESTTSLMRYPVGKTASGDRPCSSQPTGADPGG